MDYCETVTVIDEMSSLHNRVYSKTDPKENASRPHIRRRDYKSGRMTHEGIQRGKAILGLNKRSDNSIIQSVNIWSESGLASQSEWLNRFSGAHISIQRGQRHTAAGA